MPRHRSELQLNVEVTLTQTPPSSTKTHEADAGLLDSHSPRGSRAVRDDRDGTREAVLPSSLENILDWRQRTAAIARQPAPTLTRNFSRRSTASTRVSVNCACNATPHCTSYICKSPELDPRR